MLLVVGRSLYVEGLPAVHFKAKQVRDPDKDLETEYTVEKAKEKLDGPLFLF